MTAYVFVTGGVVSSVGKGIVTASLGNALKARGFRISVLKLDPYLNVDPGTMSPYQHGEVYVTDDGAETDLDLGHYERFLDENFTRANSASSGQVYDAVIRKERRGDYLGRTIQPIPHVTSEIRRRIVDAGRTLDAEIVIVEVGGTVGDMEGQPFLEAISQIRHSVSNTVAIHVTLLPYIGATGELKTKPTQHSVRELRTFGLQPDVIVTRSDYPVPDDLRAKISMFCNVAPEAVVPLETVESVYAVPIVLEALGLPAFVLSRAGLADVPAHSEDWIAFVDRLTHPKRRVAIAIVGKYVELHDAYMSIRESLVHATGASSTALDISWVHAEDIDPEAPQKLLGDIDGIVLCPGFGERGLDGKIAAARYAREQQVPFLGICLGLQMMVCEFARNVAGLVGAHSTEADPHTPHPVISLLSEQQGLDDYGGTMRLGGYDCHLDPESHAGRSYGTDVARERHRHRYEVNNHYLSKLAEHGLVASGWTKDRGLVEIMELQGHPWMVGTQFHPEFTSRPLRPHPLFRDFVAAAIARRSTNHSDDATTDGDDGEQDDQSG